MGSLPSFSRAIWIFSFVLRCKGICNYFMPETIFFANFIHFHPKLKSFRARLAYIFVSCMDICNDFRKEISLLGNSKHAP
jgi:hypothetical protein